VVHGGQAEQCLAEPFLSQCIQFSSIGLLMQDVVSNRIGRPISPHSSPACTRRVTRSNSAAAHICVYTSFHITMKKLASKVNQITQDQAATIRMYQGVSKLAKGLDNCATSEAKMLLHGILQHLSSLDAPTASHLISPISTECRQSAAQLFN
jgi:hypothetical protein